MKKPIETIFDKFSKLNIEPAVSLYGKDVQNQWRGVIFFRDTQEDEESEIYFGGENPPLYKIMERIEVVIALRVFLVTKRGVFIKTPDAGLKYLSNEVFFADGITPTREMFGERPKRKQ